MVQSSNQTDILKKIWSKTWDRFDKSKLLNTIGGAQAGVWSKLATWTSRRDPSKLPTPFMRKCASAKYPTVVGTPTGESQTSASTNSPLSQMVFQFFVVHVSDTINKAEMTPMAMAPLKMMRDCLPKRQWHGNTVARGNTVV